MNLSSCGSRKRPGVPVLPTMAIIARGWHVRRRASESSWAVTPEEMFTEVDRRCATQCVEFASAWRKLLDVLSQPPEAVLIEGVLGEGWIAEEAIAAAMYCFWRFPDDFRSAVLTAINTDGDSDTLRTITGSIAGV